MSLINIICFLIYVFLTFCCGLILNVEGALNFNWKESEMEPKLVKILAPKWTETFNSLILSIDDLHFRESVKTKIAHGMRSGVNEGVISYCDLSIIKCKEHQIEKITLHGMENGKIYFEFLPSSLQILIISDSILNQEFIIAELPPLLHFIEFNNVTFISERGKISSKSKSIRKIICKNCGIKELSFTHQEGLVELDISGNQLTSIPVNLPKSLLSLTMEFCPLKVSLKTILDSLPKNLHEIHIGYTQITDIIEGIKNLPNHIYAITVSGNLINDNVQNFIDALMPSRGFIEKVIAKNCSLTGELNNIEDLTKLQTLDLSYNRISAIPWKGLPSNLEILALGNNLLKGNIPIKDLSPFLTVINVSHNILEGNINIEDLPPDLMTLDVSNNNFSGNIDLSQLPESIRYVYLQFNHFQGTPNLVEIPVNLRHILIHNNDWDSLLPPL